MTNHGYRDGRATGYQAVLQTGTAVLVDDHGVPRVRCACGNPLLPPVAQKSTPRQTGDAWPGYRSSNVVVVAPATQVVNQFVVYDPDSGDWFTRDKGDTGTGDKKTKPPASRPPSRHPDTPSPDESTSTASTPPCDARSPGAPPASSCPPSSVLPPSSPATQPPSSVEEESPASEPAPPPSSPEVDGSP